MFTVKKIQAYESCKSLHSFIYILQTFILFLSQGCAYFHNFSQLKHLMSNLKYGS